MSHSGRILVINDNRLNRRQLQVLLERQGYLVFLAESGEQGLSTLASCEDVRSLSHRLGQPLQLRVGLHCGPVVAGLIGKRKQTYDLWGDAVNTANRLESQGVPGKIQVTKSTYLRLSSRYHVESRGEIALKGKGPIRTFLLKGRLPP